MDYARALQLWQNWPLAMLSALVPTLLLLIAIYLRFYVDIPRIQGVPEIPGGSLFAGHLYELGDDHATTLQTWSLKYDWPVFQLRMGCRRAIVINSFAAAREWMVKYQSATKDRPWFYTFHGVISKTSGMLIRPKLFIR